MLSTSEVLPRKGVRSSGATPRCWLARGPWVVELESENILLPSAVVLKASFSSSVVKRKGRLLREEEGAASSSSSYSIWSSLAESIVIASS